MKLNDICNNERFAKGELYGSCDDEVFIRNEEYVFFWYTNYGLEYPYKYHYSGFTLSGIISDDWKLYKFIDGKMVEVREESFDERISKCTKCAYLKALFASKGALCEEHKAELFGEQINPNYKEGESSNCVGVIAEEVAILDENGAYVVPPEMKEEAHCDFNEPPPWPKCKNCNEYFNSFDMQIGYNKCIKCLKSDPNYNKTRKEKGNKINPGKCGQVLVHDGNEFKWINEIMQPIEAIRWMRENPGKVIVAVERPTLQFKWDGIPNHRPNIYSCDWADRARSLEGDHWRMDNSNTFFAYTYRIDECA